jgi:dolichol-phosphate mannosyltransferase
VAVLERSGQRDLSRSVIDGLQVAPDNARALVVMDADLSHPPEAIPAMLDKLDSGNDMVIASRYMPGGTTDAEWGLGRMIQSRLAGWMSRPLVRLTDPMSGFFAIRPDVYERGKQRLNPIGYKIGLELIVMCQAEAIGEVPIHFSERIKGKSKLTLRVQWQYLRHVLRLMRARKHLAPTASPASPAANDLRQ